MKTISAIINHFSEEDKKEFINYLNKKNRRGDVKNIMLFKILCSEKKVSDYAHIYNQPSRNAYHALCNRLQNSLVDFVASKSFSGETSEEMEIMKLLLASRIFFEHKNSKVGFKTLLKAEQKALELDLYSILNEIYHTKIQYAHLNPKQDLSEIVNASQKNMLHFQKEFRLNMAYASIKKRLKNSPTIRSGSKEINVSAIIEDAFLEFNIEISSTLTYKSLYQLMNITSKAASLQSDFNTISPLMKEIYETIESKKDKTDKHLFYHIEILHLMAVSSFRNKNFDDAKKFTDKLELEMQKKNKAYFKLFNEKHTLIKAMILNYTDHSKEAIDLLQNFKQSSTEVLLAHCTFLFQQGRFQEAYQIFKRFDHSDVWYEKKNGWLLVLKKNIIEILLLTELNKVDLLLSRLQAFKRKFNKHLKEVGEARVLAFMSFVNEYSKNQKIVTSEKFRNKVEETFNWIGTEREDIFVMSFYAWLKAKMEKKNLYDTTLKLVQQK